MSSALVIFSGITFSYNVLDDAFEWAKDHNAMLTVLFLRDKPEDEGYGFPSDLDAAQKLTDESDSIKDDDKILQGKIKQVLHKATAEEVDCTTKVSSDTAIQSILEIADNPDIIFVDEGREEGSDDNTPLFDVAELIAAAPCPVEAIKTI